MRKHPDRSILGVLLASGMSMESVRANVKLAISGGQNEPRKAIAGTVWALLSHPEQLDLVRKGEVTWLQAFEEYARWISPIGMSPRRIAKPWSIRDVSFELDERVFLMFGSANRDEQHFERADQFDVRRDTAKSVAFRRRSAFLRRRLGLARHDRRCRAANFVRTCPKARACRRRAGADRRLGVPRAAEFAGEVAALARQRRVHPERRHDLILPPCCPTSQTNFGYT
ncbi:cytochrome P450 [Bradyrhizobium sp. LM3.2]